MQKKKILIIPPDTPHPSYIASITNSLAFLEEQYSLHPLDSLTIMEDVSIAKYYHLWSEELAQRIPHYDAFFGFSLGGVILQQCLSLFSGQQKPIILFSTPSFADLHLQQKLNKVIALCRNNQIHTALATLYEQVYYPDAPPLHSHLFVDEYSAAQRVIYGLSRVLATDSRPILNKTSVRYVHFIGAQSQLVTIDQIIRAPCAQLVEVPDAGMRVLSNNPLYCQKIILETLT